MNCSPRPRATVGKPIPREDRPMVPCTMARSVHVIAALDVALGGPSYSVPRLCAALAAAGANVELFSVANDAGNLDRARCFARDWAQVPVLRDLRCSSGLMRALHDTAPKVDIIHDHG